MTEEFTIGIEEEYLLVDKETLALVEAPESLMEACKAELDDQVSPEFLQCQIEIGTHVCQNVAQARADLGKLRSKVSKHAAAHGLAPIAASCHPFSAWRDQHHTNKDRYNDLRRDLGGVARRLLISGMHVHVGLPDVEDRIDIMNQLTYFLPGRGHWPRLLPADHFRQPAPHRAAAAFQQLVGVRAHRRRDCEPRHHRGRVEDLVGSAPLGQIPHHRGTDLRCLAPDGDVRLKRSNQRWRMYDNFLISENRWHAMRYGVSNGMIDLGRRKLVPFGVIIDELIGLISEDAEALGCLAEVEAARDIVAKGNAADRQRQVFQDAVEAELPVDEALRSVVRHLIDEFHVGL